MKIEIEYIVCQTTAHANIQYVVSQTNHLLRTMALESSQPGHFWNFSSTNRILKTFCYGHNMRECCKILL